MAPVGSAGLPVYGVAEIAEACGVSRQVVAQWRYRGKLPPPDAVLAAGPVWLAATIEPWLAAGRPTHPGGRPAGVLIGDLVGSRQLPPAEAVAAVRAAVESARSVPDGARTRRLRFEPTAGDEWEGVLGPWSPGRAALTARLLHLWHERLNGIGFRVGIGVGEAPAGRGDPRRMTGGAFFAARQAIEQAKAGRVRGVVLAYDAEANRAVAARAPDPALSDLLREPV